MVYYFRKMLSAEQNYNIINKKLLIIVATLKEWYIYIKGVVKTIVYINHKNLLSFIIIKELNRQQIK